MEKNIKIRTLRKDDNIIIFAQLKSSLYENIVNMTSCPQDKITNYLTKEKEFNFKITDKIDEQTKNQIVLTIEKIANEITDEELWLTLLTNNGKTMMPAKMHEIMKEKYRLTDEVEWYTALFFVNLGGLATDPPFMYRSIEEDIQAGDCYVYTIRSKNK